MFLFPGGIKVYCLFVGSVAHWLFTGFRFLIFWLSDCGFTDLHWFAFPHSSTLLMTTIQFSSSLNNPQWKNLILFEQILLWSLLLSWNFPPPSHWNIPKFYFHNLLLTVSQLSWIHPDYILVQLLVLQQYLTLCVRHPNYSFDASTHSTQNSVETVSHKVFSDRFLHKLPNLL